MSELNYDKESENILKQIEAVNKRFSDLLSKYIIKYSVNGTLQADDTLATLEQDLIKILKEAGYTQEADKYIQFFTQILQSTLKNYSRVAEIELTLRQSKAADYIMQSASDSLKKIGIMDNFINPLAKQIRTLVLSGSTYEDFGNFLKNSFIDNQKLTQYVGQITKGIFGEYDGALQNQIRQKYNAKKFHYIGQEVATSRPFCIHMVDTYGSMPISLDDLRIALDEYCPGGVPSTDTITIKTPYEGKTKTVKKGAGMEPGTTVENFEFHCGGLKNGCNHTVRWILE